MKKKNGLKKSLILLSFISTTNRKKILSRLSLRQKTKIINFAYDFGGWDLIKKHVDLKSIKIINKYLKKLSKGASIQKPNFYFELIYIIFIIFYTIFLINRLSKQQLLIYISNYGVFVYFLPILSLFAKVECHYIPSIDLTNKRDFLIDLSFGLISGFILYQILILINIFENTTNEKQIKSFIMIITTLFIVPYFEELLFRFIVINCIFKKFDRMSAALFSSFIFALLHLPYSNPLTFIFYFIAGNLLALIYIFENNLAISIIAHSFANFLILFI